MDLEIEPAHPHELQGAGERCVHVASFDARHERLGHAGAAGKDVLRKPSPSSRLNDELSSIHLR